METTVSSVQRCHVGVENEKHDGLMAALGMEMVEETAERVVLSWTVQSCHLQPMGIVHGGVHCAVVETACSVGAWVAAQARDPSKGVVGLDNHTTFVRATRVGQKLTAVATPITRGRTTQVWEATIRDEQDRVVATGRLRLLVVDGALGQEGGAPSAV